MAVLVTGAMGHIGLATVRAFTQAGIPVVAQYNNSYDPEAVRAIGPLATWVKCDLADRYETGMLAARADIEGCIHSAALPNDKAARPFPLRAFDTNIMSVQLLLEAARQRQWRRFLTVSSGAVFQRWVDTERPIAESEPASPVNVYGTTKHCAELLTSMYSQTYGVSAATVRISWVYGPPMAPLGLDGPRGPIPYFLRRALEEGKVQEESGGDFAASFTHVDDCAGGFLAAWNAPQLAHHVYHLGSGENYSTARVARAVQAAVPESLVSVGPGTAPWSNFTVLRGPLASARMREEFGFTPAHTLESGIAHFSEWLRATMRPKEGIAT